MSIRALRQLGCIGILCMVVPLAFCAAGSTPPWRVCAVCALAIVAIGIVGRPGAYR